MKLAVSARDLPALTRFLTARAGYDGTQARLVSTYFDTADRALARHGLELRVRAQNGKYIQTVKSGADGASPLARGEWEDTVASATPDPQAPETGRFIDPETAAGLVPLFRTEVSRHVIPLRIGSNIEIEVAIDRGVIRAIDRLVTEPISEVEFELKSGPAVALCDVALELLAVAPVRLERRSKSARGYALASPEATPVAAVHASRVPLDPAMRCGDALQRIGLSCLDQVMANEAAALAGLPEGIHQMRVGIRRLRALLSAFDKLLPADQRRNATAELRWLGAVLGAARNLDVFENTLVMPAQQAIGDVDGIIALEAVAEQHRKSAYVKVAKAIRSRRYTASLLRLVRWFETAGWCDEAAALDAAIRKGATDILDRRRRVARRRSKGFAGQSSEQRHRLRIALKKLRYASEMLGGLYDASEVARFVKPVKRLQDDLGDINDVHVGHAIVAALTKIDQSPAVADAGSALLDWQEHRVAKREAKLRRCLDRVFAGDPFWPS